MQPVIEEFTGTKSLFLKQEDTSLARVTGIMGLASETAGRFHVAAWNGHEFETIECFIKSTSDRPRREPDLYWVQVEIIREDLSHTTQVRRPTHEQVMHMHRPIDKRIIKKDIDGAIAALPNADNNGWLFYHCDDDFHQDHETQLEAAVVALFQPWADAALNAATTPINHSLAQLYRKSWKHLVDFRDLVVAQVLAEARTRHIGYYQQNPTAAHIHEPIARAIVATHLQWRVDRFSDLAEIMDAVSGVLRKMTVDQHKYQTRWDLAGGTQ